MDNIEEVSPTAALEAEMEEISGGVVERLVKDRDIKQLLIQRGLDEDAIDILYQLASRNVLYEYMDVSAMSEHASTPQEISNNIKSLVQTINNYPFQLSIEAPLITITRWNTLGTAPLGSQEFETDKTGSGSLTDFLSGLADFIEKVPEDDKDYFYLDFISKRGGNKKGNSKFKNYLIQRIYQIIKAADTDPLNVNHDNRRGRNVITAKIVTAILGLEEPITPNNVSQVRSKNRHRNDMHWHTK